MSRSPFWPPLPIFPRGSLAEESYYGGRLAILAERRRRRRTEQGRGPVLRCGLELPPSFWGFGVKRPNPIKLD